MPCKQVMENKASIQTSNSTTEVGHLKLSLYYKVLYLVYSRTEMLTEAFFSAGNQNVSFLHRNLQHRIAPALSWISAWGKSFPGVMAISCLLTELWGSSKDAELITPSLIFSSYKAAAWVISTECHHSAWNAPGLLSVWEQKAKGKGFVKQGEERIIQLITLHTQHHLQLKILLFSPVVAIYLTYHIHAPSSAAQAAVK